MVSLCLLFQNPWTPRTQSYERSSTCILFGGELSLWGLKTSQDICTNWCTREHSQGPRSALCLQLGLGKPRFFLSTVPIPSIQNTPVRLQYLFGKLSPSEAPQSASGYSRGTGQSSAQPPGGVAQMSTEISFISTHELHLQYLYPVDPCGPWLQSRSC